MLPVLVHRSPYTHDWARIHTFHKTNYLRICRKRNQYPGVRHHHRKRCSAVLFIMLSAHEQSASSSRRTENASIAARSFSAKYSSPQAGVWCRAPKCTFGHARASLSAVQANVHVLLLSGFALTHV